MPGKSGPIAYYWDACVFLSYLEEDPDRAPDIEAFLGRAEEGEIQILTSTVSIVEVAYVAREKQGGRLSAEDERRIEDLWRSGAVELVEFHTLIGTEARELVRRSVVSDSPTLKPLDAIHLATAVQMEVDEFHSYDGDLRSAARAFGKLEADLPKADQLPLLFEAEDGAESATPLHGSGEPEDTLDDEQPPAILP